MITDFLFLDELAFKGLLNYFTVHIFRPEAILTSQIDDLFKSLNDVLDRATPDLVKLNYTAMNTWSAANHEQKWPHQSHFHPSLGGADRHLDTLSVTAPGGRFYTDPTWIRQSGQSSRCQTVTESLRPERPETPSTQHDTQTVRAHTEILEADKLAWAAGKGGGRWWAQAGETDSACKIHSVPWAPR